MPNTRARVATRPDVMGGYQPMTALQATALTRDIVAGVEYVWDMVVQAYNGRADIALGYESWDAYCATEFATAKLRIPVEKRAEKVASLRAAGMSTRAIAAATGDSQTTVRRDLATLSAPPTTRTTGLDGRSHPTTRTRRERVITPRSDQILPPTRPARVRARTDSRATDTGERERIAPVNIDAPGWGVLAIALQQVVDNPPPLGDLADEQRELMVRNMAAIVTRLHRPARTG
jgi:hypothetical protein